MKRFFAFLLLCTLILSAGCKKKENLQEYNPADYRATVNVIEDLLNVDATNWKQETRSIEEFYSQFGDKLPKELKIKLDKLKQKLN